MVQVRVCLPEPQDLEQVLQVDQPPLMGFGVGFGVGGGVGSGVGGVGGGVGGVGFGVGGIGGGVGGGVGGTHIAVHFACFCVPDPAVHVLVFGSVHV